MQDAGHHPTTRIYINKFMHFTVFFYFALLKFLSDTLILKVRKPTPWFEKFEWNAEKIMQV